jgi:Sec7-like guanine-nucleotide exchange factor
MMMLHTDAFNRHNKNKMSKADYVRNTRLDGVSPLVLEVS